MTDVDRSVVASTCSNQQSLVEKRRTVFVLGASNVSLAWSEIVSLAIQTSAGPIDLVTAHGMGRAYVTGSSGFAFCRLPGILRSGLWNALGDMDENNCPSVLMTDLGNDLLYGRSVAEVIEGANECIRRIRDWSPNADFVLTAPPLESVIGLGATRFRIFRNLFFPFSTLSLPQVKQATQELFDGIRQIAADEAIKLYEPPGECFGFDPIHVGSQHRRDVFCNMLAKWKQPPCSPTKWRRFRKVVPQSRFMFRKERRQPQPTVYSERLRVFAY